MHPTPPTKPGDQAMLVSGQDFSVSHPMKSQGDGFSLAARIDLFYFLVLETTNCIQLYPIVTFS